MSINPPKQYTVTLYVESYGTERIVRDDIVKALAPLGLHPKAVKAVLA